MHSAIYRGAVDHHRYLPKAHAFRYRVSSWLVDLDELHALDQRRGWRWLFGYNRRALWSIYDADHGELQPEKSREKPRESSGGKPITLREHVIQTCVANGQPIPARIALLSFPRFLGFTFNPLALFYCYDRHDQLFAVIHQVTNTFHQRHHYFIPVDSAAAANGDDDETAKAVLQHANKLLYVSPFMPDQGHYQFRLVPPAAEVGVTIDYFDNHRHLLTADLQGKRHSLTLKTLLAESIRTPLLPFKVVAAIHWQALKLWLKGIAIQPRPSHVTDSSSCGSSTPPVEETRV